MATEGQVYYAKDYDEIPHPYKVIFFDEVGAKLVRGFFSPFLARKFVNKLKHSKKCELVSYPLFT